MLQDVPAKKPVRPLRKRKLVDGLMAHYGTSIRRATAPLKLSNSVYLCRAEASGASLLKLRIKEMADTRLHYAFSMNIGGSLQECDFEPRVLSLFVRVHTSSTMRATLENMANAIW